MKNGWFNKICASIILMAAVLALALHPSPASSQDKKSILILHSYNKGLKWTDNEDEGMRSVLKTRETDLDIRTEYMDTKHYSGDRYERNLYDLYRQKYGSMHFDSIILSDEDAYAFMLKYHDSLFPKVPVVFCGVNFFDASMIEKNRDMYTGVVEAYDIRNTLRTALKLHPGTYRIVVINDRSATGLANKKILSEVMPEFERKVSVVYLEDLDMTDLLKKVGTLAPGDIILLMTFNKDKSGKVFVYDDSISLVAKAAKVPMYGVWDFYLGKGIVGGMLTSGRDQGMVAASMALEILDGRQVRDIPVVKESPNRYMFDYTQMRRFDINPGNLPEGSIIINKPVSFYEENRGKVWIVIGIILALTGMLVVLMVNIEKRKKTETYLRMSEEKFEKIFRFSPDWIAILRLSDGSFIEVNDAFVQITGYSRDDVVGKTALDIGIYANPDDRYELDRTFLSEGRTQNQELQLRMKSGEIRTVQRSGELVEIGGERCIVSIVRDITDQKRAEQVLMESERIKKLLNETQIKMLQAQIKPHFLFNAITAIINYTRINPKTASELLVNLAEIFRKSINPGTENVPLSTELEHCENYIGIEKARFEDRIHVKYDIDDDVLECKVPPLILQPLVENALKHGILPRERGGEIVIGAHRAEGGSIKVYVRDDGIGMDQEKLNQLFSDTAVRGGVIKGSGIALKNVNSRLVAIYGAGSALVVESSPDKGTTVSFTLPPFEC